MADHDSAWRRIDDLLRQAATIADLRERSRLIDLAVALHAEDRAAERPTLGSPGDG